MKRALVLDDEWIVCALLEMVLAGCGYEVTTLSSPKETAIFSRRHACPLARGEAHLFDTNRVCADLIVTDVEMPDISGLEYVKALREVGCRVRHVAAMSGQWEPSNQRLAEDLGCKIYSKPFDLAEFQDWVMSLQY